MYEKVSEVSTCLMLVVSTKVSISIYIVEFLCNLELSLFNARSASQNDDLCQFYYFMYMLWHEALVSFPHY